MNQRPRQPSRPDRSPAAAELPPSIQLACRALGLELPPLAYRSDGSGGWTIIAADGRKFHWNAETRP
ncbi:hypothetical protein BECAL_00515 [Bellilinea caldifistulae]|uniref:Uncharacterized protein n=1 Tax=Bellilinea caldifistulae TaxID=360411 RepID=A0A0P6Y138_9CHLR|nr:hypothetical protein AC812_09735 [Bellilinea caldifistulae]GAP09372.1 hypothetical protein BECAL_00515 [Bellilinea caldifistulae]